MFTRPTGGRGMNGTSRSADADRLGAFIRAVGGLKLGLFFHQ